MNNSETNSCIRLQIKINTEDLNHAINGLHYKGEPIKYEDEVFGTPDIERVLEWERKKTLITRYFPVRLMPLIEIHKIFCPKKYMNE